MNHIITLLLLMAFMGCGSNNDNKQTTIPENTESNSKIVEESSPQYMEKSKTPPAIPKI